MQIGQIANIVDIPKPVMLTLRVKELISIAPEKDAQFYSVR